MSEANPSTDTPAKTIEAFFTRQRANEGIELMLDFPDGSPSSHRIKIRGMDSDAFKEGKADSRRRLLELAARANKSEIDAIDVREEELRLVAILVISWTFETPCTPDNVLNFLREAPQIADQIDRHATRRGLFFRKDLPNSTPLQSTK